ncbi:hypothetical protein LTR17_027571 [Elasticomyces elasticus]|nr:hypothetical protein LTR17_027571 [Elasticomyces elasticus]
MEYTKSHDELSLAPDKQRIPELIEPAHATSYGAQKLSTLSAAVPLTAPAIPMLFMSQEFLEWGTWSDRQELDWSKAGTFNGTRTLYRDLIRLLYRWWGYDGQRHDTLVIVNFANRSFDNYHLGFPQQGRWHVCFNPDWQGYSPDSGGHQTFDADATTDV